MPPNGQLNTAQACELLDVEKTQLYRWLEAGYLTAEIEPTAGRGRALWNAERVHALAEALPPKLPGRTRQARRYLKSPS